MDETESTQVLRKTSLPGVRTRTPSTVRAKTSDQVGERAIRKQ